eukprot:TRINITY_DN7550_c0_g1_i1.p1 TRINITY_DN7550_c0_g1~~TRINITY_DN7550_c0_g1_i1.p1  ORF type:complete len:197 (+),score=22.00 TRINITY_DN7550_c0_g1_i1:56-592(+)
MDAAAPGSGSGTTIWHNPKPHISREMMPYHPINDKDMHTVFDTCLPLAMEFLQCHDSVATETPTEMPKAARHIFTGLAGIAPELGEAAGRGGRDILKAHHEEPAETRTSTDCDDILSSFLRCRAEQPKMQADVAPPVYKEHPQCPAGKRHLAECLRENDENVSRCQKEMQWLRSFQCT